MVPLGSLQNFLRGRGTGALRNCCCISEVLRIKNQIRKVLVKKLIQSYSNWVPISPTEVESEPNLNAKSGLHKWGHGGILFHKSFTHSFSRHELIDMRYGCLSSLLGCIQVWRDGRGRPFSIRWVLESKRLHYKRLHYENANRKRKEGVKQETTSSKLAASGSNGSRGKNRQFASVHVFPARDDKRILVYRIPSKNCINANA
jgi:hypothetical protein